MPTVIITGSGGLIGSEAVRHFASLGYVVLGIDNDLRSQFFGIEASTAPQTKSLQIEFPENFQAVNADIRDADRVNSIVRECANDLELLIHAAAQPSHDWAASDAQTDFTVNANGTLNMLEAIRHQRPEATFIHMSTNKVYGDRPNLLPLYESETRLELPEDDRYFGGIDTSMSIDHCMHSIFGASKVAADVMVQEYGRYFGIPTVCFRGGCLTGPAHAGAKLHGFLSYLMRCTVSGDVYTIFGYGGKQVRDNIHSADVVKAMELFHANPSIGAVYNLGGGRESNVSMLEAIALCEEIANRKLTYTLSNDSRAGDHRWYISDLSAFKTDYPSFRLTYGIRDVLQEIHDANVDAWASSTQP